MSTRTTRTYGAALAAAALLALTGCGAGLGPDVHPGRAALVGDTEITLDKVDSSSKGLCVALRALGQITQPVPMGTVRATALDWLVRDILAHRFAEEHDIDADATHRQALAAIEEDAGRLPETSRAPFREFAGIAAYVAAVTSTAGAEAMAAEGSEPEREEAQARGAALFEEWREGVEVDVDPRFGSVSPQGYSPPADVLSEPVSALAKSWADGTVDPAAIAALPAGQRCG